MNENNLWIERWKNREIGFDQIEVNPFMLEHFSRLDLDKGSRIFVPLCGKSVDMTWLLAEGYKVLGVELSEEAIIEFFEGLSVTPTIAKLGEFICYSAENIEIFVGDIFKLDALIVGKIDAIYDRASLVALTADVRVEYTKHLRSISNHASQFLLCFEYEQALMNRSPYSVDEAEVQKHYGEHYKLLRLCKEKILGGFKGKIPASDVLWLLK
jgi:thiopurine S-methyltransferase